MSAQTFEEWAMARYPGITVRGLNRAAYFGYDLAEAYRAGVASQEASRSELKAWADMAVDDLRARLHEAETETQRLLDRLAGGMKLAHQAKVRRLERALTAICEHEDTPLSVHALALAALESRPRPSHDSAGSHEAL